MIKKKWIMKIKKNQKIMSKKIMILIMMISLMISSLQPF